MNRSGWNEQTADHNASRRAGGRRRYNRERQAAIAGRRFWVGQCVLAVDPQPGTQSKLARYFGVSRATITRDVHWLRAQLNMSNNAEDRPTADTPIQPKSPDRDGTDGLVDD